jgi:hypothetical protein
MVTLLVVRYWDSFVPVIDAFVYKALPTLADANASPQAIPMPISSRP